MVNSDTQLAILLYGGAVLLFGFVVVAAFVLTLLTP